MSRFVRLLSRLRPALCTPNSAVAHRRLFFESLEARQVLSTFTVINTDDSGAGSLRQAILDANDNADHDEIVFNIPGPGVHTIEPLTNLPFTSDVTIDGTTQPGFVAGGPRLIELSGVNYEESTFPFNDFGLNLGSNSTVQGLAINRFFHGIRVTGNNNHIAGNYIGTDPCGSIALSNYIGVELDGSYNLVGADGDGINDVAERNIISGNSDRGVNMNAGFANVVAGNYIGTDAAGMTAMANNFGVRGGGYGGGLIIGNVVSGNGVGLQPDSIVVVQGNLIGTDKTGETALPNQIGIFLQFTGGPVLIGGATPQARNYVTGNSGQGIVIYNDLSVIQGNYIGRTPAGVDLGNGEGIAQLFGSTVIGGRLPGEGNVIAGNSTGIRLEENYGAGVDRIEGNLIVHNWIGVGLIDGTSNQVIGGTDPGAGNTIAYNAHGVVLGRHYDPDPDHPLGTRNRIVGNSIFGNEGLGIDLTANGLDGVTANDPLDADTGANEFQNFPVLTAASRSPSATTHVQGSLHSTPSSTFNVDFYANFVANPSGYGEGERYLGAVTVVTDAGGDVTFDDMLSSAIHVGEFVTATATDALGNTSEFSAAVLASVQEVQIDVKPGDSSNVLNLVSNGVITVALFSTAGFDAAQVNVSTVIFAGAHAVQSALQDVNGDGRLDLLLHFRTKDTALREIYAQLLADDINEDGILDSNHQAATVTLTGETTDHAFFEGVDKMDLFLSGKALRSLLDALASSGAI